MHRQSVVYANKPPVLSPSLAHPAAPPPQSTSQNSPGSSPTKKGLMQGSGPHQSPIPRRRAPPPPVSVNGTTSRGGTPRMTRGGSAEEGRKRPNLSKDNRYSLQISSNMPVMDGSQKYGSLPRKRVATVSDRPKDQERDSVSYQGDQFQSLQRPKSFSSQSPRMKVAGSSPPKPPPSLNSSTPPSTPSSSSSPRRGKSESLVSTRPPMSPDKKSNRSHSQDSPRLRSSTVGARTSSFGQNKSSSSSPYSSPRNSYFRSNSKENDALSHQPTHFAPVPALVLPTSFSSQEGGELVASVRNLAGITHHKAQQAVGVVLEFLKRRVPECEGMVDGLFVALEQAMVRSWV